MLLSVKAQTYCKSANLLISSTIERINKQVNNSICCSHQIWRIYMSNMWVFRLSLSSSGGNPQSDMCLISTDIDYIKSKVKEYRNNTSLFNDQQATDDFNEEEVENDDVTIELLMDEFFNKGKLRQGWGTSCNDINLDLNLELDDWIANYIILDSELWGYKSECSTACGRYNILNLMTEMERGDIIFIPRTPTYDSFTVVTVKDGYFYEPLDDFLLDGTPFGRHGHVISVDEDTIKTFEYGDTFRPKVFNPYRKAVNEVKNHHQNYQFLAGFIDTHYR